jgi:broad-specificity NMP kinase
LPALTAYLITGIPGAGKTTVARLLAQRFPLAAHVEGDRLQELVVSGGLWPDQEPREEALRQLRLRTENAALLAESFHRAGIVPVVDDVVITRERLAIYTRRLSLRLVVLAPALEVALQRDRRRGYKLVGDRWAHLDDEQRQELGGVGLWIDTSRQTPERTVDAILSA